MNLQEICSQVVSLQQEVSIFMKTERLSFSQSNIEVKGLHDFVSYVDKESEKRIIERLKNILPGSTFLAEEGTVAREDGDYLWIIDPLDGTTNYIHGISPYAISIALMHQDRLILGAVMECSLNECFYAWEGSPAYLNGKEISVSNSAEIKDAFVATGFPYYDFSQMEAFKTSLEYFMRESHGIRRLGSAATDLVYVAAGRFEIFYEYSLQPWDVAAGAFILQQAGGKVCDFSGKNNYIFGKEIIATNGQIHKLAVQKISNFFKI
ncbi:inositol monophosphatase family protein [Williamwhitmania taraxaci]|uniref:Inositol-1-monophosphatase n=1 Tax=Williamwhitmania taraxaci TaxID=1640674 RepID=A0A1G6GRC0_9BACT|nr:inositol monophosphatase family protein [Williamwhitmania taraxaci]SDB84491.1 myo-inositol-1(or 4)-monophosphatase [Williamwhitmania taraxaci]